ncbi:MULTISPECIES: ABC transporter permease [unclassified Rhodococcus (in: high G+C Gram-positive bacteria)]|uniref:ABC transporter permease n=1 Tax=unclassified Rhodococcus (in: high G+C Gram-positive bacteria) TaxID=192944 RepID=UPI001C9A2EBF|nr:ABC transporter permease [Rhodococcus sp. NBC_00294]MBY6676750.1 ABC transporter permease [Rhodococcus sp. BP-332]MBY6682668.1 ABC transporter permease [Rhodococcus sp. BP-316]
MTDARTTDSALTLRHLPEPDAAPSERSIAALLLQSGLHCGRLLTRWRRDPGTIIQAVIYPVLFLLMLRTVLGNSVTQATGVDAIFGTVPLIALVAAMSGSLASAIGLRRERKAGLLGRFYTLPTHRAAGLVGRLMAEALRVVLTTCLIYAVGFALGFRFDQGIAAGILSMGVPLMFGTAFAVFVTFLAISSSTLPLVEVVGMTFTILMFFNSGFVPTNAYPPSLRPVVEHNPISTSVDTMKALTLGGPLQSPAIQSVVFAVALLVLFLGPAIRGYRKAAGSPT